MKNTSLQILFNSSSRKINGHAKLHELMISKSDIRLFKPYTIWVLAPHLETEDPNLQHYYDFTQSIREYTKVFEELKAEWKWQPVTLKDYKQVIRRIAETKNEKTPLILNLCDGDEVNGTPGISVIHALEKYNLIYTGSDVHFYEVTTSKVPMKKAFDKAKVPSANWRVISEKKGSIKGLAKRIGTPIIIKPAVSGGSMGVSVKNVVHTEEETFKRVEEIYKGYRGWNLLADGLIAEQFITGPEFTTMITGSADDPANCIVYEPVERVFHPSLPESEKFLSFDRLWEIYEDETPMPGNENFYEYKPVQGELIQSLKELSLAAFRACGGTGYTRIDIRQDSETGKLYVLEVNAQCGLSEDEDYTSIGAILKASGVSFTEVICEILKDGLRRSVSHVKVPVVPVVPIVQKVPKGSKASKVLKESKG
jgi:D-alanine-D-alanine ligase